MRNVEEGKRLLDLDLSNMATTREEDQWKDVSWFCRSASVYYLDSEVSVRIQTILGPDEVEKDQGFALLFHSVGHTWPEVNV